MRHYIFPTVIAVGNSHTHMFTMLDAKGINCTCLQGHWCLEMAASFLRSVVPQLRSRLKYLQLLDDFRIKFWTDWFVAIHYHFLHRHNEVITCGSTCCCSSTWITFTHYNLRKVQYKTMTDKKNAQHKNDIAQSKHHHISIVNMTKFACWCILHETHHY